MEQFHEQLQQLDLKHEKAVFSRIGFSYFLMVIIATVLQVGIAAVVAYLKPEWMQSEWYFWIMAMLPLYLIAAPVCVLKLRSVPSENWEVSSLKLGEWLQFFMMCVSVMYIGNIIGQLLSYSIGGLLDKEITNGLGNVVMGTSTWINMLFAVLIVPFMEELLFRKLLIDRLHKYGDKLAVLVSALMFGLVHGNFYQFFYAFGIGAIFAFVYIKTRKLSYTVLLHMAINALGSVIAPLILRLVDMDVLNKLQSGDQAVMQTVAEALPGLMLLGLYGFLMIGLAIGGIVFLVKWRKKVTFAQGSHAVPKGKRASTVFGNAGMIAYILSCVLLFVVSILG